MKRILPGIKQKVALAPFTTMKVGGAAAYFIEPASVDDIRAACAWAGQNNLPVFTMGLGSNLVISDAGYNGLVIRLNGAFSGIQWKDNCAQVLAGTPLGDLVAQANAHGMAGMEQLAGIPGSVGGAVCMNAGAFEQSASDTLVSVASLAGEKPVTRKKPDMVFSYRHSTFSGSTEIITEAEFSFTSASSASLAEKSRVVLEKRRAKQPWNTACAGSTFKRPPGGYAGTLIEQAGLKGKRVGGAEVSAKHAGFIINTGTATAMDIRRLVDLVIETVEQKHGIRLEPEVVFVGDFDE